MASTPGTVGRQVAILLWASAAVVTVVAIFALYVTLREPATPWVLWLLVASSAGSIASVVAQPPGTRTRLGGYLALAAAALASTQLVLMIMGPG